MRMLAILAAMPLLACSPGGNGATTSSTTTTETPAAVPAQGSGTARTWNLAGFDRVSLRGSDDVKVTTGPFAVRAEGPARILDELQIEKVGTELRIGRREHQGSWTGGDGDVTISVTLPSTRAVSVTGSGDLTLDRAAGDFTADNTGSGSLKLEEVRGGTVALTTAGSGEIEAKGAAEAVKLAVTGSADIDADDLTAKRGDVTVSGSGSIKAKIDGPATVSLSGSGDADLGSGARCTVSKAGTGEAKCGG